MTKPIPTVERLRELLHYCPETGVLTWKVARRLGGIPAGSVAGSVQLTGYRAVSIDGSPQYSHRVAWAIFHGMWSTHQIDHLDGIRTNNSIKNLRDVPPAANSQNKRIAKENNLNGLLGVSHNGSGFMSRIQLEGKVRHLGTFKTPEAAHQAYLDAKRRLHEGCTI